MWVILFNKKIVCSIHRFIDAIIKVLFVLWTLNNNTQRLLIWKLLYKPKRRNQSQEEQGFNKSSRSILLESENVTMVAYNVLVHKGEWVNILYYKMKRKWNETSNKMERKESKCRAQSDFELCSSPENGVARKYV